MVGGRTDRASAAAGGAGIVFSAGPPSTGAPGAAVRLALPRRPSNAARSRGLVPTKGRPECAGLAVTPPARRGQGGLGRVLNGTTRSTEGAQLHRAIRLLPSSAQLCSASPPSAEPPVSVPARERERERERGCVLHLPQTVRYTTEKGKKKRKEKKGKKGRGGGKKGIVNIAQHGGFSG